MRTVLTLIFILALSSAHAQQGPPPASPKAASPVAPPPDQLEPAVDTRSTTGGQDTAPAEPASRPPAAPGPSAAATTSAPPAGKPVPAGQAAAATGRSGTAKPKGPDRVELETTDITGNRELPKVLYIVPWKRSDLGDLVGKPANSLLDEVLQPIDRDVFLRENHYYDALKPDRAPAGAGTVPGSGDKH